jgi:hypothetical protein
MRERSVEALVIHAMRGFPEFKIEFRFNPGGVAVWGETWVKIQHEAKPVVEACLSKDFSYIRQWDGRNCGRNISLSSNPHTGGPSAIAKLVRELAAKPFRAF